MAKTEVQAQALPYAQRQKIWRADEVEWLNTLRALFPQNHFRQSGRGDNAKITCNCLLPTHADTNASAVLHLGKGFYRCLGGSCNAYTADPVELVARAKGQGYQQAFKALTAALSLRMPSALSQQLGRHEQYQKQLAELHRVCSQVLLQAAAHPQDPSFAQYQDAVRYLLSRGFTVSDVAALGVGVFPNKLHLHRFGKHDLRDRVLDMFDDLVFPPVPTASGRYTGWLTFAYETTPGVYANMKLRCVKPGSPQYKHEAWWGAGDKTGLFGLSAFKHLYGSPQVQWNMHIVEGEFDALASIVFQSNTRDYPFVAASGGGLPDLQQIAPLGAHHTIVIGDDDAGGTSFARNALGQHTEQDVDMRVYRYDPAFPPGSDPYDLVLGQHAQHAQLFFQSLTTPSSVLEPHTWAVEQVQDAFHADPHMSVSDKAGLVRTYARAVTSIAGRDLFVDHVHRITGMPRRAIRAYMVGEVTDGRSYNLAIEHQLLEDIEPLINRRGELLCYARHTRSTFSLPLVKKDLALLALNRHVFREVGAAAWVESRVGIPAFISHYEDRRGRLTEMSWTKQNAAIRQHIYDVVSENVVSQTPIEECVDIYRQGVHVITPDENNAKNRSHRQIYVLNGDHLFRTDIYIDDATGDAVDARWSVCGSPKVADDTVFLVGDDSAWSENLTSLADLENMIPLEHGVELHAELVNLLSSGWNFAAGEDVAEFIASLLPTLVLHQLSDYCPMLHFTGKTQAGKSTFTKGMLRGDDFNGEIHLVEHVKGFDDYSVAGLIMSAEGDARLLAMDEFEDPDDTRQSKRKSIVNDIYETARNIPTGMTTTRGTPDGGTRTHRARTGIVTSGIHPIRREVDANRYFTVALERIADSVPPKVRITNMASPEQIKGMRRQLTLFALHHSGALWKCYNEVKEELTTPGVLQVREYRFLQMIMMTAAYRKLLGLDYIELTQRIITLHERNLATSVMAEEEQLFRAIIETRAIAIDEDSRELRSLQDIVNDGDGLLRLSSTDCGVYFVPDTDYLILYPPKLVNVILRRSSVYRNIENPLSVLSRLKPHAMVHYEPDSLRRNRKVLRYLNRYITLPKPDELLLVKLSDLQVAPPTIPAPESSDDNSDDTAQ